MKGKMPTADANSALNTGLLRGNILKQLGVNYRWSEIVEDQRRVKEGTEELKGEAKVWDPYGKNDKPEANIEAGDRTPDCVFLTSSGQETTLLDILVPSAHTALILSESVNDKRVADVFQKCAELNTKGAAKGSDVVLPHVVVRAKEDVSVGESLGFKILLDSEGYSVSTYGDKTTGSLGPDRFLVIIVRPDGFTGAIVYGVDGIDSYFKRILQ